MNKNLVLIIFLIIIKGVIGNPTFAISKANISNNNDIVYVASDFDEAEIYNAFSEINDLLKYVSENDSATYSDVQAQDSSLLQMLDNEPEIAYNQHEKFTFNKQTAYLSGCIFGAIGIALVAIVNNGDQERLKNAIWGCATTGCVSLSSVIAFYVFFFSYFALYW